MNDSIHGHQFDMKGTTLCWVISRRPLYGRPRACVVPTGAIDQRQGEAAGAYAAASGRTRLSGAGVRSSNVRRERRRAASIREPVRQGRRHTGSHIGPSLRTPAQPTSR